MSAAPRPWDDPEVERLFWRCSDAGIAVGIDKPTKPNAAFSVLFTPITNGDRLVALPRFVAAVRTFSTEFAAMEPPDQHREARKDAVLLNFFPAVTPPVASRGAR